MRLKTAHKNRKRNAWRARAVILLARLNRNAPAKLKPSPEATGVYECLCGNTVDFIGVDARGYGGPSVCECAARDNPEVECECLTELRQPFHVDGTKNLVGNGIDYEAFEGGGYDAHIGSYTSIICARCNQVDLEGRRTRMTPQPVENTNPLTYANGVFISDPMPRRKTVDQLLREYQTRRTKETGKPFTQADMAEELKVPVGTLYHWMQTPGTVGHRSPRGLTREMLMLKLESNGSASDKT